MKRPSILSWGIGSKLAATLVGLMLAQQTYEVFSDNRFTTKIIEIHGRSKMAESESALRAFYAMTTEDAKQRLQELTREPRFKAVLKLGDRPTLETQLRELLVEQRGYVVTFSRPDGTLAASASRPPGLAVDEFARRVEPQVTEALSGTAEAIWKIWGGRPLTCVSVPVVIDGDLIGALTFGSEIGEQTLKVMRDATGAEIALHDRERILRKTPGTGVTDARLLTHYEDARLRGYSSRREPVILPLEEGSYFAPPQALRIGPGEHAPFVTMLIPADEYLMTSGEFVSDSVVRNSINAILATMLVILVVARLTAPIRALQFATERLSGGDLDHRVQVQSSDELGRLGTAFNDMARRVAESRRQLAETNASLERQVEERTRSLQDQIRRRESAELELQRHASQLEERVLERTAEIEQALTTLDGIKDAALVFDARDLRLTFANQGACLQFEQPREVLLGTTYPRLVEPVAAAELSSILESARQRSPAVVQFTTSHVRTAGQPLPVEVNLQYSAPEGRPPCYIAIARDVSERRQLEERRNRTQRMEVLGTMASGVAHDLNNALAPIAISIEMLRAKYPQDAAMLDMLDQCSRRGASMVRQLLTFARGREGERSAIDGRRLLNEMAHIVRSTFPRNINLEVQTARTVWDIEGDATQLHQVLLNLCVNARDAMPSGGLLRLGIRNAEVAADFPDCVNEPRPGPHVCLSVADGGTGMPPHVRAKIFDPFFTTKAPGSGTGLGLSTVLGIVRSHGGFVRLQTQQGKGSLFEVYLPARKAAPEAPAAAGDEVSAVSAQGRRVLLVDDEKLVRESCSAALATMGFEVMTAADGQEALLKATEATTPPGVVITDLDMPILGGRGLIEALRETLPDVPVIVTSGVISDEESVNLRRDPRVRVVLQKPFALKRLADAIEEAIQAPRTNGS